MKRLTTLMTAAAASIALAAPLAAQSNDNTDDAAIDLGTATGTFTSLGFNNRDEDGMRATATGNYDSLTACLTAAAQHHEFFATDDLFKSFDVATRVECAAADFGVTVTSHYGSPIAINRLKQRLPR